MPTSRVVGRTCSPWLEHPRAFLLSLDGGGGRLGSGRIRARAEGLAAQCALEEQDRQPPLCGQGSHVAGEADERGGGAVAADERLVKLAGVRKA